LEIVCPNGHTFEKVFQLSLHGEIMFQLEFWKCPKCRAESNVRRGMYSAIDGRLVWQRRFD